MRSKLIAEALGTFILVFAGTAAICANGSSNAVTLVGIALTFGLAVMAVIYALGNISGAHLNPAVTIGFALAKRFPLANVVPYVAAQLAGAFAASALVRFLFPDHPNLGSTLPTIPLLQTFVLEVVLTFILMFVILRVACGSKEQGLMAGIAVGGVIAIEVLAAGTLSGASMNPARSLAPAVVSGTFNPLWVYLTAPVVGAGLAVPVWHLLGGDGCDPRSPAAP